MSDRTHFCMFCHIWFTAEQAAERHDTCPSCGGIMSSAVGVALSERPSRPAESFGLTGGTEREDDTGSAVSPDSDQPHRYTVDVYLHGAEPYPCVICGQYRQAAIHREGASVSGVRSWCATAWWWRPRSAGRPHQVRRQSCGERTSGRREKTDAAERSGDNDH